MFYFSRRAKASGRVGAMLTIAALTLSLAQPIILLALPSLARAVTVDTIFENGFESDDFSFWTSAGNKWDTVGGDVHSGDQRAEVKGNTSGDNILQKDQSTAGYENIELEYWYKSASESLEAEDKVFVEYTINGTDWVNLFTIEEGLDDGEWHEDSHSLPLEANNNSDFAIRFRANLDAGADVVKFDDVKLTGEALPEPGSIAGFKYHDEDANGEQGEGEDGLEDWEIALYDENGVNIIATTTTDSDGSFEFSEVFPGNYRVCEPKTFPTGGNEPWWIQTEPAENEQSACFDGWRGYDVMVAEGEEVSEGIIFGNAEGAVIGGWKYADPDADGEHEDESDGVLGFTINLYQNDGLLATKQTLNHPEQPGQYYFERLWPGEYLICEEQQTGWVQTGPTTTEANPLCENEGTVGHLITVEIGEWNYENHFHNRELEPGSIAGFKYHDEDANGEQDEGEDGLEDWEIALYDENGVNVVATTTTDSDGNFEFPEVAAGNYRVCEPKTFPAGGNEPWWIQTEPAENEQSACFDGWRGYDITVEEEGEVSGLVFGNAEGAVIGGWKYADPDADSEHEDESDGVSGFTINLYRDGELQATKQTLNHPEQPGQYYFERLWPGEYLICEEQQPGWVQTGPTTTDETHVTCDNEGTVGHLVTVEIGEWNYENHFHNRELEPGQIGTPMLISPFDGIVIKGGAILTNLWTAVPQAVGYRYESYNDELLTSLRWGETVATTSKSTAGPISTDPSAEATFWWRVKAIDGDDNESAWTDAWQITIDNTAPTTTITSPNPDSTFEGLISIEGYTNDNVGVGTTTLTFADATFDEGWTCGGYSEITVATGTPSLNFNWSYDWTPAEDGTYCIKGAGTDLAGNEEGSAIIFPVTYKKSVTPPPAPPEEEEDDDGGGSSGGCYNCGGGSSIGGSTTTEETFGEGGDNPILALGALGQLPPRNEATGPINDGEEFDDDTATTTGTSSAGVVAGSPLLAATGSLLLDWWWLILLIILAGIAGWWYWRKYKEEGTSSPRQPEQPMF